MTQDTKRHLRQGASGQTDVKHLLEVMTAHVDHGISIWDPRQVLVLCNRRFIELIELSPDRVVPGKSTLLDIVRDVTRRGDFGDRLPEEVHATLVRRTAEDRHQRVVRRMPSGRCVQSDRAQMPDGALVISLTDISDQKATEAQLIEARNEAERARRQLIQALNAMSEGFVLWDADDRLVTFNAPYRDHYSYTPETLVPGVPFEEVLLTGMHHTALPLNYDKASWIKQRREQHRNPSAPYVVNRLDGRSTLMREYRTDEG